MRVVCDNCGASYKIPDSKLTREVNKATCRKCGNPILIRRPELAGKEAAAAGAQPAADERTLITSAAELERQARARAGAAHSIDEGAVDPRPTQVSPDNSHTEATVPRDEAAERGATASAQVPFLPAQPPSGAYVSTTLVPEGLGHSARPAPPPAMQVPSPIPPPAAMPQARAVAAYAPPPAAIPPAPAPSAAPPPPYVPSSPAPSASAPPRPAVAASGAAHNPSGDLTFALLLSLVSVFGVLLVIANGLAQSVILAGVGTFLALLGGVGSALVVLTGNRGTRPASVVLAIVGGFLLAFIGGIAQGFVNYTAGGVSAVVATSRPAEVEPKPLPPVPAPVEAPPAPEADPALALAAPPVETPPAPPVEAPPAPVVTPPPAAAPPAPAPATTSRSSTPSSSSSSSSRTTSTPERIAPKTTAPAPSTSTSPSSTSSKSTSSSEPSSTSSSSKSTSSSSSSSKSTEAAPAKAATLDTRVIDTMIKNNKGVKLCFIKQKNDGGALPSGVKVKITVQPSGTVSSAKIPSGEWKDSDFDGCLSGAVKSIQFPPFEGDPLTLTYPFPI